MTTHSSEKYELSTRNTQPQLVFLFLRSFRPIDKVHLFNTLNIILSILVSMFDSLVSLSLYPFRSMKRTRHPIFISYTHNHIVRKTFGSNAFGRIFMLTLFYARRHPANTTHKHINIPKAKVLNSSFAVSRNRICILDFEYCSKSSSSYNRR